jgi:hypothetical protein
MNRENPAAHLWGWNPSARRLHIVAGVLSSQRLGNSGLFRARPRGNVAPSATLKSLELRSSCFRGGTAGIRNLSNAQLDERQVARRTPPLIPKVHLSDQLIEVS